MTHRPDNNVTFADLLLYIQRNREHYIETVDEQRLERQQDIDLAELRANERAHTLKKSLRVNTITLAAARIFSTMEPDGFTSDDAIKLSFELATNLLTKAEQYVEMNP